MRYVQLWLSAEVIEQGSANLIKKSLDQERLNDKHKGAQTITYVNVTMSYKYDFELSSKRKTLLWLYQVLPNIDIIKYIYLFRFIRLLRFKRLLRFIRFERLLRFIRFERFERFERFIRLERLERLLRFIRFEPPE